MRRVTPKDPESTSLLHVSGISFVLGIIFALGSLAFVIGGFGKVWWATYQLGFFMAAWAAFHFGEFALTAGWNTEKCTVDCKSIVFRREGSYNQN